MGAPPGTDVYGVPTLSGKGHGVPTSDPSRWPGKAVGGGETTAGTARFLVHLAIVFAAYFAAGKLGQATTNIRSSNLGPVWPAYGIALAAFIRYGYRVWPALAASAFLVAAQSTVSPLAAAGQAAGATLASLTGARLLRRFLSSTRRCHGCATRSASSSSAFGSAMMSADGPASRTLPASRRIRLPSAQSLLAWDSTGAPRDAARLTLPAFPRHARADAPWNWRP